MTLSFTPAQSSEIDDRIVEMIVAVFGEGPEARRCRAIANERWLDAQSEDDGAVSERPSDVARPIVSAPRDRFIRSFCPDASRCGAWPTAPWVTVKWHDDTGDWRDEAGIAVKPTHWLGLNDRDLQPLPSEGSALHKGDTISACEARRMAEQACTAAAVMTPTMRQAIAALRYSADPADRFRRLPRTDDEIAHELSRAADALRSRLRIAPSAEGAR